MMKKNYIITLLVILIVGGIVIINIFSKTETDVKEKVLELTPIGASIEEVVQTIENNEFFEWDGYINYTSGFVKDTSKNIVGDQSIIAYIPCFSLLYEKDFKVSWGFNAESKLIDVKVTTNISGF